MRKNFRRIIITMTSGLLGLSMFVSSSLTVNAKTATRQWIADGGVYTATITTSDTISRCVPITESQAQHKRGTSTTIGISKTKGTKMTSSVDVTAGYNQIAVLEATVGVAEEQSYSVSASVSYTLKNEASGKYRIEVVYPGKQVNRTLKFESRLGTKTRTAFSNYTPGKNAAYHRLNKYA